ncbi:MAG TPA: DNA-formamidopyrimidine glycosylase family protein [Egibacteraceae bacterium]|nr:DNA-formamidopyrimidine glycosylase family protein [Egibacteraceae bacterium]
MPEGHTTHRLAREHRRELAGRTVAVASPQGRFAAGAARLDGRILCDVEAHGKHLFYRWDGGGDTLHVHLGLVGTFRTFRGDVRPPGAATRLALRTDEVAVYLAGPMACELLDAGEEQAVRARLGPDPLRRDADPGAAYAGGKDGLLLPGAPARRLTCTWPRVVREPRRRSVHAHALPSRGRRAARVPPRRLRRRRRRR